MSTRQARQGNSANREEGQLRKPLGSPSFMGRKRVVRKLADAKIAPIRRNLC